jgi:hypothetical protein
MARTLLAATEETSGILQAGALARIGGSSEAFLVGEEKTEENDEHEPQERGRGEQDLLHGTRHRVESSRLAPRQSTLAAA